jgi:putative peptidoglycan lipid II flippase
MSLAAMMSGILNSMHKYFAAAIAPVFLNIILMVVLVYALKSGADPRQTGIDLAWGVLAAGIVQLLIVMIAVRRENIIVTLRWPRMTPNVKRMLWLAAPAAVTGGITQINLVIGQMIASTKEGAISVLQYADRIYQLPLGVVGIAVGVVLLPELARALRAKHMTDAGNLQNRSVEFALFLTLPAAAALVTISEEIIRVLYERGAFTETTTGTVSGVLAIFGLGLPAFVLIKAFTPGYFAREDTKTPMRFAMVSVGVNIVLALSLFPFIYERGIATAEVCAGWVNAGLLFFTLVRRGHWDRDSGLLRRLPRIAFSAIAMGVALHYGAQQLSPWLQPETGLLQQVGALSILIAGGGLLYLVLVFGTGGADIAMLRRNIRRGRNAAPPPADTGEA